MAPRRSPTRPSSRALTLRADGRDTGAPAAMHTVLRPEPLRRSTPRCAKMPNVTLRAAQELAGPTADRAGFKVLVGGHYPPLAAWIAEQKSTSFSSQAIDSRSAAIPSRKLRRATQAGVRVVGSSEPVNVRSGM